jgi:hypothetical protein
MHLLSVPTAGSLLQVLMLQHSISSKWQFYKYLGKNNATEKTECSDANYGKDFLKGDVNIAGTNLRVFSYAQLDAATNNLRRDMMVARGVFSFVHEGWQKKKIPLIGIKKSVIVIKKLSAGSWQGGKQWRKFDFELSLKSIALIH